MLEAGLVVGVLIFLAEMARMGSRKGLIRLAFSVVSIIVAMILSQCLSVPVSNFLEKNTGIHEGIKQYMDVYVETTIKEELQSSTEQVQKEMVDSLVLPEQIRDILFEDNKKTDDKMSTDELCEYISQGLTQICMRAITTFVMFIIISVIMHSILCTLKIFERMPVIREINKLAGAAVGIAEGIVILWIVSIVLMSFAGTPGANAILKAIDDNALLSLIYDTNIFIKLFGKQLGNLGVGIICLF